MEIQTHKREPVEDNVVQKKRGVVGWERGVRIQKESRDM